MDSRPVIGRCCCCWPFFISQVRHPKVKERMFLDFVLMKKIASFADRRPSLKWMNLGPSMEQFSDTMSAQVGHELLCVCLAGGGRGLDPA